jgi:hypothetical protein
LETGVSVDGPLTDRTVLQGSLSVTYRDFPQQPVVDSGGDLTAESRKDVFTTVQLSARMPAELNRDLRWLGSVELGYSYNSSNQNDYDAANVFYTPYFYNYGEWRIGPSLKFLAGPQGPGSRPMVLDLSGSWSHRNYPYRTAQDADGVYDGGPLHTALWTLGATLNYPMLRRWSLVLQAQHGQATSNQGFTQFYRYSYVVSNYLIGVSYEF